MDLILAYIMRNGESFKREMFELLISAINYCRNQRENFTFFDNLKCFISIKFYYKLFSNKKFQHITFTLTGRHFGCFHCFLELNWPKFQLPALSAVDQFQ